MEHERCYIYTPPEVEERPSKRQRTSDFNPQAHLDERLAIYRNIWSEQEQHIQTTLEEADGATQEKIVKFVAANASSQNEPQASIPAGLIVAGPSIASHGPFFERLGRRIKDETSSSYVVLTSGDSPNLKTFLKSLIKKTTSRVEEDEDDDDVGRPLNLSRRGPKLLDFDLGHVQEWRRKNQVKSVIVAIQDSEAFDTGLLVEIVDLFYSWLDRIPFVLLFGIATSAESFEDRLSGKTLRYLEGQQFDVTQSDEILEKLFSVTVANPNLGLRMGPMLTRRILERQKDHVQSVQDFVESLKYAYMSHVYANYATIFLKSNSQFEEYSSDAFAAVRNLPSFRRWIEKKLEDGYSKDIRKLLDSDRFLYASITDHVASGRDALSSLDQATIVLACIRESLGMTPKVRLSSIWTRAASGELLGSPLLRETMLALKKTPSDKLKLLIDSLKDLVGDEIHIDLKTIQQDLETLIQENGSSGPLRSQDDVRNESVRTTIVAQKVLLSKHKAALSEQDRAYSEIVAKLHEQLDEYFTSTFIDPRTLFLYEILVYDLKSPHTEVFQPKPRLAIERALATPHDYLGCECCGVVQDGETALSATQPATAILYQMYLESGTLINVSDLWSAFNAIVGKDDEEDESQAMALFQRALAELKFLGLVKPSRKKTDHISKMMWKGL
ncbi:Origin recognition complex subunit 3 [Kalmusia sp. IMI 367209]|nr:Origin recognition complex subunit 3 [Kalmusia sp. IMI 367209]